MIESLRWCDEMAIVTANPNPLEIQTLTSDQALLRAAVDSAQARAEPPEINWAVKVAQEIGARVQSPRQIVLITDGCARDAVHEAATSGVEVLRVGTAAANCAIACFAARRSKTDPTQCEVFVEVQNHGNKTAQGNLEIGIDGKRDLRVPFAVENNGRWQKIFDKVSISTTMHLTEDYCRATHIRSMTLPIFA